ncbi:MAG: Ig-like domain-containing protein [Faecousia sp.]
MFRTRMFSALAALLWVVAAALPAGAVETDCDNVYCFSSGDFSEEATLKGICITALPTAQIGTVMLGTRVLRPGDILTVDQVSQMTFCPLRTETDRCAEVGYLPIYDHTVAPAAVMTISVRGKEDKPPVAEDSAMETYKNLPTTGRLKVQDPEGQALTFTITRQPKRGTVEITQDGSFTYTPKKNKVGVDSFTFTATDPAGKVSREATVTITILKPTDATQYRDTAGRDCRFAAEWARNTGLFVGESLAGNACFSPDKAVTRGEFTSMLVKALGLDLEGAEIPTGYTDEIPTWLQPYLAAAVRSGLTAGLPEQDVFGADLPITGAEAAVMLQNALDLTVARQEDASTAASEENTVPVWAEAAVSALSDHGLTLDPLTALTRGNAVQILYQAVRMRNYPTYTA